MNHSLRLEPRVPAFTVTPGADLVDWRKDTLVDLLRRRAAESPQLVLYTFLADGESREISMTAAELDATARRIGRALSRLALPGARVILLFDDGLDYIAGLFGCLAAGLVAVSGVHPAAPRSAERLVGIIEDCGASIVLGQARVLADFQRDLDERLADADLRWVASDKIRPGSPEPWTGLAWTGEGPALLQYTSGSSRAPRGVMLSHRNILHNLMSQMAALGYNSGDTGVSWLPFSHDMGLIGCVLMTIYGGGRSVLLAPTHFLEDPLRWPRAIARYKATLSGGPNFAYELCARRATAEDLATLDLSTWTVAVSGAEPVRADVVRRFATVFAEAGFRAEAIRPSYGLAEATLLVACGPRLSPLLTRRFDKAALRRNLAVPAAPDADPAQTSELVGCGQGLPDQKLVIVDTDSLEPLPPGTIGEIWVAGPSIAAGYFDRPDDNAAYFSGDLGDGHGPYLRTGDLGFLLCGEIFVTGRLRDLLVIRGRNYYPQDFEHSAEASHPAIRPGCSACFLDEDSGAPVILCEIQRGSQDEAQAAAAAIRAAIVREHGVAPHKVVLCPVGAVLKTPSGKIQRAQTRAAFAEGQVTVVLASVLAVAPAEPQNVPEPQSPPMPQLPVDLSFLAAADLARIEAWVRERMGRLGLDAATLHPNLKLTELGFDSLKIVELKADLERDLGIAIPVADLYALEDIKGLADHILKALQRAAAPPPARSDSAEATAVAPRNRLADQRLRRGAPPAAAGGPASL